MTYVDPSFLLDFILSGRKDYLFQLCSFQYLEFSSVTQSCLTLLWPHGLQHTRLPCSSPTPGVYANSCPSQACYPTILSSVFLLLPPSTFPSIRVFSKESALHIRWPKFWSFSFSVSPSNEYSGLISFRIDWLDLEPRVQGLANSKDNKYLLNWIFNWAPSALTTGKKAGAVVDLIPLDWKYHLSVRVESTSGDT